MNAPVIGAPLNRVDGPLKVTGRARYSAEFAFENLAYAVIIHSAIAKGRIARIDAEAAKAAPGFLGLLTHENAPRFGDLPEYIQPLDPIFAAQSRLPLQSDEIWHQGQQIAVLIADGLERAQHAASLVRIDYEEEPTPPPFAAALEAGGAVEPETWASCLPKIQAFDPHDIIGEGPNYDRGDVERGLAEAEIVVDETYASPVHHHNPMEMHSTTAAWESADRLFIHDSSNAVFAVQQVLATTLKLPVANVRVVAPFVGGSFGCKGRVWPHVTLAAVAAKMVGRPVKLSLSRQHMYFMTGHRPEMVQRVRIGAQRDGTLTAMTHDTIGETWLHESYAEPTGAVSRMSYAAPNFSMTHKAVRIAAPKANMMHVPGEGLGSFALESAIDELAERLDMDPIDLRLKNYADVDPTDGRPFSSKSLKECYAVGAARFGWRRVPVGSMKTDKGDRLGWGMAGSAYPSFYRQPATALVRLYRDGSLIVQTGTAEQGTGAYTILAQVAAETLGMSIDRIRVEIGDTTLPWAPQSVASMTTASVAPAVQEACEVLKRDLAARAVEDKESPLRGAAQETIAFGDGRLFLHGDPSRGESFEAFIGRQGTAFAHLPHIEAFGAVAPGQEARAYSMHAFGAVFAEASVDPFGQVKVVRVVSAIASGRILNAKTARSQIVGGIVWGVGHALCEGTATDAATGRYLNTNLLEYHIADSVDWPSIDVVFVDEDDPHVNPLGAKGVGEIAKVGVIAAIANAVHNATGRRVRSLPISIDKLR